MTAPPAIQADYEAFTPDNSHKEYPYFSFKYICQDKYRMQNCRFEQLKSLCDKLRVLSSISWKEINSSPRETYGYEPLPQSIIKGSIPSVVKKTEPILVFRFGSHKRSGRIAGIKRENRFYILFIDHDYSLYDHG